MPRWSNCRPGSGSEDWTGGIDRRRYVRRRVTGGGGACGEARVRRRCRGTDKDGCQQERSITLVKWDTAASYLPVQGIIGMSQANQRRRHDSNATHSQTGCRNFRWFQGRDWADAWTCKKLIGRPM